MREYTVTLPDGREAKKKSSGAGYTHAFVADSGHGWALNSLHKREDLAWRRARYAESLRSFSEEAFKVGVVDVRDTTDEVRREPAEKLRRPSPEEITTARHAAQHSQDCAAQIVHSTPRAWRMWESGDRGMPRSVWELYLIKTGQPELKVLDTPGLSVITQNTHGKALKALEMNESGASIKEIAEAFGISRSRATQLISKGRIMHESGGYRSKYEFAGLDFRVINTLLEAGYSTKEQVRAGLRNNDPALLPRPKGLTPGLGKKSRARIVEWAESGDPE